MRRPQSGTDYRSTSSMLPCALVWSSCLPACQQVVDGGRCIVPVSLCRAQLEGPAAAILVPPLHQQLSRQGGDRIGALVVSAPSHKAIRHSICPSVCLSVCYWLDPTTDWSNCVSNCCHALLSGPLCQGSCERLSESVAALFAAQLVCNRRHSIPSHPIPLRILFLLFFPPHPTPTHPHHHCSRPAYKLSTPSPSAGQHQHQRVPTTARALVDTLASLSMYLFVCLFVRRNQLTGKRKIGAK